MILCNIKKIIDRKFIKTYFLPLMLFLFIIGFFQATEYHGLKRFFRRYVVLGALIGLQATDYRRLFDLVPARFFAVFLGYLCLSLSWSHPGPDDIFFDYLIYSLYIFIFVTIIIITIEYNNKWLMLIGPVFVSIVTLHVLVASWILYKTHPLTDRLEGPGIFNASIQLATMYSAVAAYCVVKYLRAQDKVSAIYLLPLFICLAGIILTGSRGPLLTFLLVAAVSALLIRNQRIKFLIIFIGIAGLLFIIIKPDLFNALLERGASYRPEIWAKGLSKIRESWIFGYGIATSPELTMDDRIEIHHYHNIFLATWFYGGIIGVLLLTFMVITTIVQGLRTPAAWPWLAAFVSSFLCLLTNGNRLIYNLRPEWFYFWLPFAMILANINVNSCRASAKPASPTTDNHTIP